MSKPNDERKSKIKRLTVKQLDGVTGGASTPSSTPSSAPAASSAPASSVGSSTGVLCW